MTSETPPSTLKWSSQLLVTPPIRTPKLPGDKILLPQSALEQLLAAAPVVEIEDNNRENPASYLPRTSAFDPFNPYTFSAEAQARTVASSSSRTRQPQLPHPLTFRITNPNNGRAVYAGIREFSAEEGEVSLSSFLRGVLGLEAESTTTASGVGADAVDGNAKLAAAVTVDVQQLPKGTYVRLRPVEAGYESEDWKALLERHLRENFTTLTIGEVLRIPRGRNRHFEFLVDKAAPDGNGICIVDTDLEVDIEPLNEEQARETLRRRTEKASLENKAKKKSSTGGLISKDQDISGRVGRGEYVDYELKDWNSSKEIHLQLEAADGADLDVFISPLTRRIERRYLSQMLTGCGKPWCRNEYCKTGHQQRSSQPSSSPSGSLPTSSKDILQTIKPLLDAIELKPGGVNTAPFYFCVDEMSQQRRIVGEMIAAETVYDIRWCLAALEASGGDLDKARDWLNGWAPKRDETRSE
ncbi:ubiquitin fusion degradation protein UFD1-domain-containing protein [Talaromyces proteolyticus]|uniref:Ubiquitin fusion degradation protein UFD1-domain-containing protein n=1 Tax=Talaromyces proteolyticus TaxID=1131652 RepID=A0AAD4PSE3_9EURO|nr:ubiquitin fusion degradation protein UFD1-domain-containing protein [Talaromyces proteolyticus]KAH8690967.1 ubiquitin fusion degradation protein UFD1-domain-containing protein [Talaromyces proteolyticus]